MRRFEIKRRDMMVAFVAAYMLVLQGLIGAFAIGAAQASQQLDAFGNPLCITSTDAGDAGADGVKHSGLPDCCSTACGMFAPAMPAGPSFNALDNPLPATVSELPRAYDAAPRGFALERGPGSPRSPPLTV